MFKVLSRCLVKTLEGCLWYALFCIMWLPRWIIFYYYRECWWWVHQGLGRRCGKKLLQVRQVQLSSVLHLPASALNTMRIRKNSETTIWNEGKGATNNLWQMNLVWRQTRISKNTYFQLSLEVLYASLTTWGFIDLFFFFNNSLSTRSSCWIFYMLWWRKKQLYYNKDRQKVYHLVCVCKRVVLNSAQRKWSN